MQGFKPHPDGMIRLAGVRLARLMPLAAVGRRLLLAAVTLVLVSVFVFSLQHLLPGDPVLAMAGEERDPKVLDYLRAKYRLDQPIPVQYATWAGDALEGDLGMSLRTGEPVLVLIGQKLPVTVELALLSLLVAFAVGIPAGVIRRSGRGRSPTTAPTSWPCPASRSPTSGSGSC